jgi:DNA-binding LacI/PurR family transcriptional regulator
MSIRQIAARADLSPAAVSRVFTRPDAVSVGVISRLAQRGVKVPGAASVIGFDSTGLAEMVMPLLTTVRLPAAAAGAAAVRMLLGLINGRDGALDARVELDAELVIPSATPREAARRGRGGG